MMFQASATATTAVNHTGGLFMIEILARGRAR
jgi:hypothetical protein